MQTILIILTLLLLALPCQAQEMVSRLSVGTLGGGVAAGCVASYGTEYATSANATDVGGSETDATTGWTNSGAVTFDSVTTAPQGGSTYHIVAVSDTAADHFYRDFSGLSASTMYRVSAYVRHDGTGGNWTCYLGSSHFSPVAYFTPAITSADTTYAQYKRYFYFAASSIEDFQCRSTTTDGGIYFDTFSVTTANLCLGDELYNGASAASIVNEADATTGWTETGTSTFDSVETDPQHGTSSLHMVADTNNGYISIDLASYLTVEHKYFISWKAKTVAGDNGFCGLAGTEGLVTVGAGVDTTGAPTTASWTNPGLSFTYVAANHRYFSCKENGANNNSEILLDSLSIKEILSE